MNDFETVLVAQAFSQNLFLSHYKYYNKIKYQISANVLQILECNTAAVWFLLWATDFSLEDHNTDYIYAVQKYINLLRITLKIHFIYTVNKEIYYILRHAA